MYAKPSGIQTLCIEVTAGSPSCKQTVDLKSALWKIFFCMARTSRNGDLFVRFMYAWELFYFLARAHRFSRTVIYP